MFAAPPEIRTSVHARLPDSLRRCGAPSSWIDAKRPGARLHSFLEGPSFARDGTLWMVDIAYGRVLCLSPAGNWSVALEYDGWPTGLKIARDGSVFIADNRYGILRLEPGGTRAQPVCTEHEGAKLIGVNDLFFAEDGSLYFTDQGPSDLIRSTGRVFRLRPDGTLQLIVAGLPSPNGLVLAPDGTSLFVAVTQANAVWRVRLLPDGTVGRTGLFLQLSGSDGGGPDGLAMDEHGNLAVAHPYLGSVWLFSRSGEPVARIRSCAGIAPTNLAYGGTERRTLFITESESGSVLRAELAVPGMAMHALS